MYCPHCGAANDGNNTFCTRCGKPVAAASAPDRWAPSQGALGATDVTASSGVAYAGFWLRLGGLLIDGLLIWAIAFVVLLAAGLGIRTTVAPDPGMTAGAGLFVLLFWLLVPWLYFALMECSSHQATLGKMAVGVKVTDLDGRRIGFARATGRFWGKVISQMILYIGYIMAAFTPRKQSLHDMMAGTLVVLRNPSPAALASTAAARPMAGWVIALILLACFVPIAGILAAIAIPAYADYTLRARVSEGINVASGAKARVADNISRAGAIAAGSCSGVETWTETPGGSHVASLSCADATGVVTVTMDSQAREVQFSMTPSLTEDRKIAWQCAVSSSRQNRYVPTQCRVVD